MKRRVTGIGGVFFKADDPAALAEWYRRHLGIDVQPWLGASFPWQGPEGPEPNGMTVWSIQKRDADMFGASPAPFMINYRVEDLEALLKILREEGCEVDDKTEDSEYGKFGWLTDPEGNRVELWQPPEGPMPD